ncbi:hypothetical protein GJ744_009371 [Endocarpon pusillum]|uniref:D-isomer specific 2-hydroxyacid dehydrogenase NAD-binding domain-containing protein n=1 Tax=Endocarpon pusillum TaxID=364733 RepID=A0A8H7AFW3_9EURO|nr:hypothetical protein GJ744_009371 [Endocarpon pusillum]
MVKLHNLSANATSIMARFKEETELEDKLLESIPLSVAHIIKKPFGLRPLPAHLREARTDLHFRVARHFVTAGLVLRSRTRLTKRFVSLNPSISNLNLNVPYFACHFSLLPTLASSWPDLFKDMTILATFGSFPSNLEDAPNLNLIHLHSAGIDHLVSHPLFTQTNIPITTSSGIHGPIVLSKSYKKIYELQKQHKWGAPHEDFPQASDWVGKKVGVAEYGSIGRQITRVFTSLGCQIYAYTSSPRCAPSSRADQSYQLPHLGDPDSTLPTTWYSGTTKSDLHTFLSQDLAILVISLPLTPSTRGMFGKEECDTLYSHRQRQSSSSNPNPNPNPNPTTSPAPAPAGPLLINTSRGAIIKQASPDPRLENRSALRRRFRRHRNPEPLPPASELWDMENVVLTPHMSALNAGFSGQGRWVGCWWRI